LTIAQNQLCPNMNFYFSDLPLILERQNHTITGRSSDLLLFLAAFPTDS